MSLATAAAGGIGAPRAIWLVMLGIAGLCFLAAAFVHFRPSVTQLPPVDVDAERRSLLLTVLADATRKGREQHHSYEWWQETCGRLRRIDTGCAVELEGAMEGVFLDLSGKLQAISRQVREGAHLANPPQKLARWDVEPTGNLDDRGDPEVS